MPNNRERPLLSAADVTRSLVAILKSIIITYMIWAKIIIVVLNLLELNRKRNTVQEYE